MRKSFPKQTKPLPTGVKNFEGKIITNPEEKKKVILTDFKQIMRKRPVKQELVEIIEKQEILFPKRVK